MATKAPRADSKSETIETSVSDTDISVVTNQTVDEAPEKTGRKQNSFGKQTAKLTKLMRGRSWTEWAFFTAGLVILLVIAILLTYLCWIWAIPALWRWGFNGSGWRILPAGFGLIYLILIPFFGFQLIRFFLNFCIQFLEEGGTLAQSVDTAQKAQDKIIEKLSENDPHQLVLILSYSRQMLNEYYGIGMDQAQRSFRYCLIAMWIGFIVLILGVIDIFMPFSQVFIFGDSAQLSETITKVETKASNANTLILLTGAIMEFISAAFLWVYRYSIKQITYHYNRQLKLHNTLYAYRLACTANDATKDEATKLIIDNLLADAQELNLEPKGSADSKKPSANAK